MDSTRGGIFEPSETNRRYSWLVHLLLQHAYCPVPLYSTTACGIVDFLSLYLTRSKWTPRHYPAPNKDDNQIHHFPAKFDTYHGPKKTERWLHGSAGIAVDHQGARDIGSWMNTYRIVRIASAKRKSRAFIYSSLARIGLWAHSHKTGFPPNRERLLAFRHFPVSGGCRLDSCQW